MNNKKYMKPTFTSIIRKASELTGHTTAKDRNTLYIMMLRYSNSSYKCFELIDEIKDLLRNSNYYVSIRKVSSKLHTQTLIAKVKKIKLCVDTS